MSSVKLKSICRKEEYATLIDQVGGRFDPDFFITDNQGQVLLGNLSESSHAYPILHNGEPIGHVHGSESIAALTVLIQFLAQNETLRKDLGREVLDLYREINLIYNFSEKLSDTIDRTAIGMLALQESQKLIQSVGGLVLMWDAKVLSMEIIAQKGNIVAWGQPNIQKDIEENLMAESPVKVIHKNDSLDQLVNKMLFAPLKVKGNILGAIVLFGDQNNTYKASDLKLISTISLQAASAIESALLYEMRIHEVEKRESSLRKMHVATSRFVPVEFISSLGRESLMDVQLGDQIEKIVTVVFVDIRGFTTLAESMTPEENFKFVNAFNRRLGPIIKEYQGFVNQYLGDGMMAIFPDTPDQALQAAIAIQKEIQDYNHYRKSKDRKAIKVGIGIHTGPLILGITGDEDRLDATTISDTVNTAARVESLTKYYKTNIIISENSLGKIVSRDQFNTRDLGLVQVKGRVEPISIFECFDGDRPDIFELKHQTREYFNRGIEHYIKKSFRESTKALSQVLVMNPDDETAQIFLAKIAQLITSEFGENWNGVEKMLIK